MWIVGEIEEWTASCLVTATISVSQLVGCLDTRTRDIPCEIVLIVNNPVHEFGTWGIIMSPQTLLEELWFSAEARAREMAAVQSFLHFSPNVAMQSPVSFWPSTVAFSATVFITITHVS